MIPVRLTDSLPATLIPTAATARTSRVRNAGLTSMLCAMLFTLSGCENGPEKCEIGRIGPLTVLNPTRSPIVRITINGKPAAIIVDSGAMTSLIVSAAARDYDLSYTGHYAMLQGTTGPVSASIVTAGKVGLGEATASDVVFTEVDMKRGKIDGLPIVGLLGADFLANYDVKFDLPHGKITLYRMRGCSSKDIVWPVPVDAVPLERGETGKVMVPFKLNGKTLDAILDSGADYTVIRPSQARRAGVTRDMLTEDRAGYSRGISDDSIMWHRHRFDTLEIGPKKYHNISLQVAPLETDTALLGADFLRHAVAWLSYRNLILYIERPEKHEHVPDNGMSPGPAPAPAPAEPAPR
ncbi:aspartyl protease family protein [Acetobacter oeni]|uniref:Peptidase A2 domain-containing protein n=1 Tax=Acetobacter oeni TaxID=304077 RepID=A0A511XGR8_9PROT|nr:aspartyl protease family protein [Acetobacter oeni]MBB3881685.1 putative aspartyl protease [Acetobacter oeni]NHO17510.1 hypothetical protein [Acetobacter oeni]GBR06022.1 hypothetical protein AA21952_1895 [Acetobacter oeni LMG 21952]GEN62145.1 hypothetical protein AOE01nite_03690 [Acetobacter oeni]